MTDVRPVGPGGLARPRQRVEPDFAVELLTFSLDPPARRGVHRSRPPHLDPRTRHERRRNVSLSLHGDLARRREPWHRPHRDHLDEPNRLEEHPATAALGTREPVHRGVPPPPPTHPRADDHRFETPTASAVVPRRSHLTRRRRGRRHDANCSGTPAVAELRYSKTARNVVRDGPSSRSSSTRNVLGATTLSTCA